MEYEKEAGSKWLKIYLFELCLKQLDVWKLKFHASRLCTNGSYLTFSEKINDLGDKIDFFVGMFLSPLGKYQGVGCWTIW